MQKYEMNPLSPIRLNSWREIAIFMVILMEVSWITPWFKSLTPETYAVNSLRVYAILAMIVLFSHILVRIMEYLHLKKSIRQGLMITLLIIGSYIGIKTLLYAHESIALSEIASRPIRSFADLKFIIPVEFIVIITVLIGFWRGVSLAQEHIGPSYVMVHFWTGIIMFVVFIFIISIATGENAGEFFYIFLSSSLIGLCAARMTVVGMVRGGKENRFNRAWFLGIILAALIVVGLSSIIGELIADKFTWIGVIFTGLFGAFVILLWMIISPISSFLITSLGNLFDNSQAIKDLGDSFQNLNNLMRGFGEKISDLLLQSGIGNMISRWLPIIKTFVLVSIIILLIAGIIYWMAIRLWRDRERHQVGDEEKSKISGGNILKSFINRLLHGWNKTLISIEQLTDMRKHKRLRAAARIRQIYADLMEFCESLGQPRPEAQTPLEFIPKLERIFPEFQSEISMITLAYIRVRYGLLPENKNDVDVIESAWKKVHAAGEDLLHEQKHSKKKASGN